MSVAQWIARAIDGMGRQDPEAAFVSAFTALDATAELVYPSLRSGEACKRFIDDNFGLITNFTFGNLRVERTMNFPYHHPRIKRTKEGLSSLTDILYHIIRCDIVHKAKLPPNIEFSATTFGPKEGKLLIPANIVNGLIAAVVGVSVNKREVSDPQHAFFIHGRRVPLNGMWGRKDLLEKLLKEPRLTK